MPATIPVGAFIFGAILILIAIVGGGFEIFDVKISGTVGKTGRFIAGLLGAIFIVLGLGLYLLGSSADFVQGR